MPCLSQYNYAHQNFKAKLCPELDGVRAETARHPQGTHRGTPLAFETRRSEIYCEKEGFGHFLTFKLAHCDTRATWLSYYELHVD